MDWLRGQVAPNEILSAAQEQPTYLASSSRSEECMASDIAFGQPAPLDVIESTSLKWVHLTSAGYTAFDRQDMADALTARGAVLTNSSSVYNDPCAQSVLAFMLSHSRRLGACADFQAKQEWGYNALRSTMRILRGDKVLLVGYGAIARRLSELLAPFRVEINGLRRTVSGDEPVSTYPISRLDEHLAWADHVVNILPLNPTTKLIFQRREFELMKPGAVFYNIGRGDTVDQPALISALESEHLSAAYLDVCSPEPLPAGDPLWSTKNLFLAPHLGGGMQNELQVLLDHFVENHRRFVSDEELLDRIY